MSICYGKTFKFLQKLPNASIIHAIFNKILHPFSFAACVKLFPKSHTKPSRGYFSEIFRLCQKNITKCKICFHGYSQISPGAKGFYFRYFPHFQLSYQLISDSLRFFCRIFLYFWIISDFPIVFNFINRVINNSPVTLNKKGGTPHGTRNQQTHHRNQRHPKPLL